MALRRTSCGVDDLTAADGSTPLWDTRNRRRSGSEQSTSSGFSSCSSPEGHVVTRQGADPFVDHARRCTMAQVNSASFTTDHVDGPGAAHAPSDDDDDGGASHVTSGPCPPVAPSRSRIKIYIRVQGESDETCLRQIYKPILDLVDPDSDVIDFIDDVTMDGGKWPLVLFGGCRDTRPKAPPSDRLMTSSLAVVVLLDEEQIVGSERLEHVTEYFRKSPWKFHHSEWVSAHRIRAYPYNSLDYFSVADELPVCSVRQVHGSKEHVRVQRYVSHGNWTDTLNFYRLIINRDPDYHKSDFCVFTVEAHRRYTIQFALKRLPRGISVTLPCHTVLNFRVSDVGALLPLLPHACRRLAETRWRTTDLDGNELFLETAPARRRHRPRPRSRNRSQGSRKSASSASSFASVLLDTAREFLEAEESASGSVFSEPYVCRKADGAGFRDSPTPSHSATGHQAALAAHGRAPSDVSDVRATPERRRFAWVSEMMGASSAGGAAIATSPPPGGSHQHTDSGFADDKSDESDRNNHGNVSSGNGPVTWCRALVSPTPPVVEHHYENWGGQRNRNRKRDDADDNVDPCDLEIERLRLYQSDKNLPPKSRNDPVTNIATQTSFNNADDVTESPTHRLGGDIAANGRRQVAPPDRGVHDVRATSCVPRDAASPGFRRIPARCTSTPLTYAPRPLPPASTNRDDTGSRDVGVRNPERRERPSGVGSRERQELDAGRLPKSGWIFSTGKNPRSLSDANVSSARCSENKNRIHDDGQRIGRSAVTTVTTEVHRQSRDASPLPDPSHEEHGSEGDQERSYEEAAIDCPPSLTKSGDDRPTQPTNAEVKVAGNGRPVGRHLAETAFPVGCVTSLPRSRSASKMVTFAEEVQEKDISVCAEDETSRDLDRDASKTSRRMNEDSGAVGFWI